MTPKLTDQFRRLLEDCLNQFNNAVQVKIFNKFSICDPPHFDASGLLHSNRFYDGTRVSILVDDCDVDEVNDNNQNSENNHLPSMQHKTEHDYDPYERVLNVREHVDDTLYAYYYTNDNQSDNIENVRELLDISKNIGVNRTEHDIEKHEKVSTPAIVNNWNSLQSDFLIDEQTVQSMETFLKPIINSNVSVNNSADRLEQQQTHQQHHPSIELSANLDNLDTNMTPPPPPITFTSLKDHPPTTFDKNNSPSFLWQ